MVENRVRKCVALTIQKINKEIDKLNIRQVILFDKTKSLEFYDFVYDEKNYDIIVQHANLLKIKLYLNNYPDIDFYLYLEKYINDLINKERPKYINIVHFEIVVFTLFYIIYKSDNENGILRDKRKQMAESYKPIDEKYYEAELTVENFDLLLKNRDSDNVYYRGQTNINWRISPSMLRNLPLNMVIDKNSIAMLSKRFDDKYNKIMDYSKSRNFYEKLAFQQHSISYSPMVDITRNGVIAGSFALSNSASINDFNNNDAVIYKFKIDNEKQSNDMNIINGHLIHDHIFHLPIDGFYFGGTYKAYYYSSSGTKSGYVNISFKSFKDIMMHLVPSYAIYDSKSNDRMIYQQGSFLYLYGQELVSFNGVIFFELNPRIEVYKYTIPATNKISILNKIKKDYPYYDLTHLMNPYLYFSE